MQTELIPVIHMIDESQVFRNIDICLSAGIEKVFLINHAVSTDDLLYCAFKVRDNFDVWVGVNLLGKKGSHLLQIDWNLNGIWCDETLHKEDLFPSFFEGTVFSGLAFKYQPQPADLKTACDEIKNLPVVATTSGVETGHAAPLEKIKLIRSYLGDHPLAIASGVSAENILDYKGIADYLLVATSITDEHEFIMESKLRELKDKLQ